MKISEKDIRHIAGLARLKLTDKEIAQYRREISGIVRYVERLADVNVSREEATARLGKAKNFLREDVAMPWAKDEQEATLSQAPRRSKKFIAVPRIFES